ncbi:MAG: acyl-CoA thioesterase [Bacteroidales bacterium]|jgi:acyl-CoA thioester hydrolase|nr:acyl-CoA thioesterase [Bacteroidales bacterium]
MYNFDFATRVEYVDTDKMGVMHNSRYFLFFEKGRTETMRHIGIGYKEIESKGIFMPLVEQYARYFLPAYYDELLIVRTCIKELPMAKIQFYYDVIRSENGKEIVLCSGYNSLAFVNIETKKPLRCPKWVLDKLQPLIDSK